MATWGRVPSLEETVGLIDAVTTDQVRGIANGLASSAPALALYGPIARAPSLGDVTQKLAA
jgi:hypothetical protein